MQLLKQIQHKLAHLFRMQLGHSISWEEDGKIMRAFQCATCGKLDCIHESTLEKQDAL